MINLQYISDQLGNKTAVVIPIDIWEKIPEQYRNLKAIDNQDSDKKMSQEEFLQWIEDAEQSPTMSLETFNEKWELKRKQIQNLTR